MCRIDVKRDSASFVAPFLSVFELCQETDRGLRPPCRPPDFDNDALAPNPRPQYYTNVPNYRQHSHASISDKVESSFTSFGEIAYVQHAIMEGKF